MTTVMTPVCLFLLFLSVTAAPRGAIVDDTATILRDGDIMPNTRRNALLCSFKGCRWPKSRNGRVYVPYLISSSYTRDETIIIVNALNSFMTDTCVTFVMKTWQWDYLDFFPGSGCWSYLGRTGGRQRISLQQRGCVYKGTVQHEALHALGFHHEQARSDRDQYVSILTQNIRPGAEGNFKMQKTNNLDTRYDFNSIMHYSKYAFSKNRQPTIVAKHNPNQNLGGAKKMSKTDILRVNKFYRYR
ncbi:high choriolytic enzyme 2-like [Sebastes umbrosus]|uniref:high choriolytic enzyme 2-like n=1 Tax=Sebastes umbrosus TaxID=72105 RepID=UPI00189E95C6|nr:high choriolytic enzyme 2-like [Sebastes umbrosus]